MELIASSRIIKAQQVAARALPFTRELNRAVSAVANKSRLNHPLTRDVENPQRVAVLFITSDRGMNGAYSSNVIKTVAGVRQRLHEEGREIVRYVVGRKGVGFLKYRGLPMEAHWEGFSDAPSYDRAVEISDRLLEDFLKPTEEGGVDEIWAVYTRMESMLTQTPRVRRLLPLEVVEGVQEPTDPERPEPLYLFEPDPESVLDALLPLYIRSRVWFYLLQSAASQLASQQRAMKSATDNAQQLIERLTREANAARQSEITQEISEIVGGASALADLTEND
jgi:F-type H+-transporting ATPase subunit gamma